MTSNDAAEQIHIIEYDPSYAGAIADMWNLSNGGGTKQRTEEIVLREMEISSNLLVFLAVDGKEVIGCPRLR